MALRDLDQGAIKTCECGSTHTRPGLDGQPECAFCNRHRCTRCENPVASIVHTLCETHQAAGEALNASLGMGGDWRALERADAVRRGELDSPVDDRSIAQREYDAAAEWRASVGQDAWK
jgi:hypothetical protein